MRETKPTLSPDDTELAILPRLARTALDQYLVQRGLPVTPARWTSTTPIVASLEEDGANIETTRLGRMLKQFFRRPPMQFKPSDR